jgi:putative ABC transport system permease protein
MKFFPLVWSNLKRKKLRTLLTLLSIIVAFFLYGMLCALSEALTAGVSVAGVDRLITRHKVSIIQMLPFSYQARIAAIPGVSSVAHQSWFGGIYQDPKNFFASIPVEPEPFLDMFPEFILPDAEKQAWRNTRTGAIVGRTTAQRFGWKVGDRIPLQSPIWQRAGGGDTWEFDIVGIFDGAKKGTDTSTLYFRYDYFDEGRAFAQGQVGWFTIRVADPAAAEQIAARVDEEFVNSAYETKTEPEGAFMQGFAQQVGDIGAIVTAILSAVFFTILLVAGNTMAQAVRERTEEIGVLKAMGFSDRLVLTLVLAESGLIAALGGFIGLGLGWLMTAGGSPAPSLLPVFYLPAENLLWGVALVAALGLVTGLLPALQAMRLSVAQALRSNA